MSESSSWIVQYRYPRERGKKPRGKMPAPFWFMLRPHEPRWNEDGYWRTYRVPNNAFPVMAGDVVQVDSTGRIRMILDGKLFGPNGQNPLVRLKGEAEPVSLADLQPLHSVALSGPAPRQLVERTQVDHDAHAATGLDADTAVQKALTMGVCTAILAEGGLKQTMYRCDTCEFEEVRARVTPLSCCHALISHGTV